MCENDLNDKVDADYERRMAEARMAEGQAKNLYAQTTESVAGEPCRLNLRERVDRQLNRASREARRAADLGELQNLLQRYRDVARILDLIESTRV